MNEKRIREVIEVEQRALELLAQANREAERIPLEAEAEAAAFLDSARRSAQDQARRIIDEAQQSDEAAETIARAQAEMMRITSLADKNLEKAIAFVVDSVLGRS